MAYGFLAGQLRILHCNDVNCAGGDDSITVADASPQVGAFSSLALDASGNPGLVAYLDEANSDLKLLHCNDAACAGGDESITSPDTAGFVGYNISLRLDSAGRPVIVYYDSSASGFNVMHCNDANCAGGDESITLTNTLSSDFSLQLDASGNPVISYLNGDTSDLNVMHCNDANCAGRDESVAVPDSAGNTGY